MTILQLSGLLHSQQWALYGLIDGTVSEITGNGLGLKLMKTTPLRETPAPPTFDMMYT